MCDSPGEGQEMPSEHADGTMREGERVVEVAIIELSGRRGHDVLVPTRAVGSALSVSVVPRTQTGKKAMNP